MPEGKVLVPFSLNPLSQLFSWLLFNQTLYDRTKFSIIKTKKKKKNVMQKTAELSVSSANAQYPKTTHRRWLIISFIVLRTRVALLGETKRPCIWLRLARSARSQNWYCCLPCQRVRSVRVLPPRISEDWFSRESPLPMCPWVAHENYITELSFNDT